MPHPEEYLYASSNIIYLGEETVKFLHLEMKKEALLGSTRIRLQYHVIGKAR